MLRTGDNVSRAIILGLLLIGLLTACTQNIGGEAALQYIDAPGFLQVTSEPTGAYIYIDDLRAGTTPYFKHLRKGEYKVTVGMPGYEKQVHKVKIRPDELFELSVTLVPKNDTNTTNTSNETGRQPHVSDDAIGVIQEPPTTTQAGTIFVTEELFTGDLGGKLGADRACSAAAEVANLEGQWIALLSTSTSSALDYITAAFEGYGIFYNIKGEEIATSIEDLFDSAITNAVGYDENGNPSTSIVWTGSDTLGEATLYTCDDWSGTASGFFGNSDQANGYWLSHDTTGCSASAALYCVRFA